MLVPRLSFVTQIGKLPLPCRSAPGFVVNRLLTPYMLEALARARGRSQPREHRRSGERRSACRWARSSSPTESVSTSHCTSRRS